jgi:hypothetical protein
MAVRGPRKRLERAKKHFVIAYFLNDFLSQHNRHNPNFLISSSFINQNAEQAQNQKLSRIPRVKSFCCCLAVDFSRMERDSFLPSLKPFSVSDSALGAMKFHFIDMNAMRKVKAD